MFSLTNFKLKTPLKQCLTMVETKRTILDVDELKITYFKREIKQYCAIIQNNSLIVYSWFLNGKRHRVDGPALVIDNEISNIRMWYTHGKHIRSVILGDYPVEILFNS